MQHYIELTLIKDSEISSYFIWSKLYTQLHLAFVEQKDANEQVPYGVSFPEYKTVERKGKKLTLLGSKLRVFANTHKELQVLNLGQWLERLTDYVHIKSIQEVGTATEYLTVSRYRPPASQEQLARRYASRHSLSVADALSRLAGYERSTESYPYIQMKSLSGDSEFSLCICQQVVEQPVEGQFSTYGLSSSSTVPHWP